MAILETGKKKIFQDRVLIIFVVDDIFYGIFRPHKDGRGGILLGVDPRVYNIGFIDAGDFCLKFHLKTRDDDFQLVLVAV